MWNSKFHLFFIKPAKCGLLQITSIWSKLPRATMCKIHTMSTIINLKSILWWWLFSFIYKMTFFRNVSCHFEQLWWVICLFRSLSVALYLSHSLSSQTPEKRSYALILYNILILNNNDTQSLMDPSVIWAQSNQVMKSTFNDCVWCVCACACACIWH